MKELQRLLRIIPDQHVSRRDSYSDGTSMLPRAAPGSARLDPAGTTERTRSSTGDGTPKEAPAGNVHYCFCVCVRPPCEHLLSSGDMAEMAILVPGDPLFASTSGANCKLGGFHTFLMSIQNEPHSYEAMYNNTHAFLRVTQRHSTQYPPRYPSCFNFPDVGDTRREPSGGTLGTNFTGCGVRFRR